MGAMFAGGKRPTPPEPADEAIGPYTAKIGFVWGGDAVVKTHKICGINLAPFVKRQEMEGKQGFSWENTNYFGRLIFNLPEKREKKT